MRTGFPVLLVSICLLSWIQVSPIEARATTLPDACGQDGIKFTVTTRKGQPAPADPEAGKAQLVFLETIENEGTGLCIGCDFVVRVGVDGAWAGANKGKSYFVYAVAPGEHHLCANWQSSLPSRKKAAVAGMTAQAGKAYYYQARIVLKKYPGGQTSNRLYLRRLSEDQGKYQVKIAALSTSKAGK